MEVRSGPAAAMDGDAQNPSPPRTCAGCRPSPASSSTGLRLCCSDLEEGVELLLLQVNETRGCSDEDKLLLQVDGPSWSPHSLIGSWQEKHRPPKQTSRAISGCIFDILS
ncbi:uncharacterized protein [Triticum aestivum]|uniref:uncharacterized protein isoform X6 n=1 Tax=Triticum aestivum TaxID=4565 RepID=UPI001D009422|nr:uncharacterized protein LOC123136254 isoform X6 [Triticum aestivum]XP_044411531.1 uncharacterized protein LOC123136254 isoform X6 [Triticum aestivum]